jgi:hypothetical protein
MFDLTPLQRLRLATVNALESAAAFVAGPRAVASREAARDRRLEHAERLLAAFRLALRAITWSDMALAAKAEAELQSFGLTYPLREWVGRIAASRLLNPARRSLRTSRLLLGETCEDAVRRITAAGERVTNLQRAHGLLLAAHNATVRALSLAMGTDDEQTRRAVGQAQEALKAQSPAMHLDIAAVVARMQAEPILRDIVRAVSNDDAGLADAMIAARSHLGIDGTAVNGGAGWDPIGGRPTGMVESTVGHPRDFVPTDEDEPAIGDEPVIRERGSEAASVCAPRCPACWFYSPDHAPGCAVPT